KSVEEAHKLIKQRHKKDDMRTMVQVVLQTPDKDFDGASRIYLFKQTTPEFLFKHIESMQKSVISKSYDEEGNEVFDIANLRWYINIIYKKPRKPLTTKRRDLPKRKRK